MSSAKTNVGINFTILLHKKTNVKGDATQKQGLIAHSSIEKKKGYHTQVTVSF